MIRLYRAKQDLAWDTEAERIQRPKLLESRCPLFEAQHATVADDGLLEATEIYVCRFIRKGDLMSEFHLDSIIETIKKLDDIMHCPFCKTDPLRFLRYSGTYSQPQLYVACVKCKLKLSFGAKQQNQGWNKPKKTIWSLDGVDRLSEYEIDEIQKGGKIEK